MLITDSESDYCWGHFSSYFSYFSTRIYMYLLELPHLNDEYHNIAPAKAFFCFIQQKSKMYWHILLIYTKVWGATITCHPDVDVHIGISVTL